jgi:hypothetical protein
MKGASHVSRMKAVELLGTTGVLILGLGAGALTSRWIGNGAISLIVAGTLLHSVAMVMKHRIEKRAGQSFPRWVIVAYWLCWFLLVGLLSWIFASR